MIQLVLSLTSSPHIPSDYEPLSMVILTLLPFAEIGGPPGLALETVEIQNESLSAALHHYTTHTVTSCTNFDSIFVMSVTKKQLRLISWYNAFNFNTA